jgi:hypothetical protein
MRYGVPAMRVIRPLVLVLVGACSGTDKTPPMLTLDGRNCPTALDLGGAQPLELNAEKVVTVKLDGSAACWHSPAGRSVYVAFRLPSSQEPYVIAVSSDPLGRGLFSPRLLMLDSDGLVLREVLRDSFLFHGSSLAARVRSHPGENYLVVASDAAAVGQRVSQISERTQGTAAFIAPSGFVPIYSGSESTDVFTYAYNGTVHLAVRSVPKAD